MNDSHTKPAVEWLTRVGAVLGLVVLFLLSVGLVMTIFPHSSPLIEPQQAVPAVSKQTAPPLTLASTPP